MGGIQTTDVVLSAVGRQGVRHGHIGQGHIADVGDGEGKGRVGATDHRLVGLLGDLDVGHRDRSRVGVGHRACRRRSGDQGRVGEAGRHIGHLAGVARALRGIQTTDVVLSTVGRQGVRHGHVGQGHDAGVGEADGESHIGAADHRLVRLLGHPQRGRELVGAEVVARANRS